MTKILVTTDMSTLGQQGVAHARALASALGAELTVLSVQPDPVSGMAGEFGYIPPLSSDELAEQENELRAALAGAFPDLQVQVATAEGRSVWQTILDTASALGANMIVMTTHGRTGLSKMLLGSVAEAVVQHATVPVLLVKGEQPVPTWKA